MDEPTPIPESYTFPGRSVTDGIEWAQSTLDHYETGTRASAWLDHQDNLVLYAPGQGRVTTRPGESVSFSPDRGFHPYTQPGPEILAKDHPTTVAEALHLQHAQRSMGVSIPEPGKSFVHRRANDLSAPTITDPAQLAAMQRHPSNALIRASDYSAHQAKVTPVLPPVPRIH